MKKITIFLSAIVILMLIASPINLTYAEYIEPQNIVSQMNKEGVESKGMSFITHDLYFDGHLLMLSVTMRPNDDKCSAVEGFIGSEKFDTEKTDENVLGAYCELNITDSEGNNIGSVINGDGEDNGNAYTKTFIANFEPDKTYDEVMCTISYGIMESPGKLTENNPEVFYVAAPIQKEAQTFEVPIEELNDDLSYINRIFVSQSDEITSVFVYYTPSKSLPIPLSYVDNDKVIDYPDTGNASYAFRAYRDNAMKAIKIKDAKTNIIYSIDIKTGKCTLEK